DRNAVMRETRGEFFVFRRETRDVGVELSLLGFEIDDTRRRRDQLALQFDSLRLQRVALLLRLGDGRAIMDDLIPERIELVFGGWPFEEFLRRQRVTEIGGRLWRSNGLLLRFRCLRLAFQNR